MESETARSVILEIIHEIAKKEGCRPDELDPPLFEVIDPTALERLIESSETLEAIRFTYRGWTVTVQDEHDVEIVASDRRG